MKAVFSKTWLIMLVAVFVLLGCQQTQDPNRVLLPENFKIYTDGTVAVNHPWEKFKEKVLPTNNDYRDYPGCYLACYSKNAKNAIYAAGKSIYVLGQIRVPGEYQQHICITKDKNSALFKRLCQEKIKACAKAKCWGGGNTGGWVGI